MNNYSIICFLGLLFIYACQNTTEQQNKTISTPSFSFETVVDSLENPRSTIYLVFDDNKVKVEQINACMKIVPGEYERHDIPASALDACGGWWAGAGDYFYLVEEDGQYLVYQGFVDEMQDAEEGYHYEVAGRLSKTGSYTPAN